MTEDQIDDFRSGYWECRAVIMSRLRKILESDANCKCFVDTPRKSRKGAGPVDEFKHLSTRSFRSCQKFS